jgi:hypothetical protein
MYTTVEITIACEGRCGRDRMVVGFTTKIVSLNLAYVEVCSIQQLPSVTEEINKNTCNVTRNSICFLKITNTNVI